MLINVQLCNKLAREHREIKEEVAILAIFTFQVSDHYKQILEQLGSHNPPQLRPDHQIGF
jgi:hypothetical protein